MDKLTKKQRQKNMKAVKSKGSKIEKLLATALWSKGYRYRKNDKSVIKAISIFIIFSFYLLSTIICNVKK